MLSTLKVVIVNWNLKEETLQCIDSLLAAGARAEQIILVDNGSTDHSVETFRERYSDQLHIIANPVNRQYAPACNQGFQLALDQGAQWILALNNDTVAAADFFEQFESAERQAAGAYAILAPLIFYHSAPDRIWHLGDHLIDGTLLTRNRYRGKAFRPDLPEIMPVDFVTGCAMVIQRRVFEAVGLFEPSLLMYGEEIDFIWRARLAGFRVACATRAWLWHKVSSSANRDRPRTRYLRTRNQVRFYRKYARGLQRPLLFAFSVLKTWGMTLQDIRNGSWNLIPALYRGWAEGWFRPY